MMSIALTPAIEALMRDVSREVVLPRYQNLAAHEIAEKAADDLVTIVDKESEQRLSEGLARLLPEAEIVGEEACAADPAILERLGTGLVWIIDPIDGTGNFAAGHPPFGILVALADGPEIKGGWILDPLTGRFCHAAQGQGGFVNGEKVTARPSGHEPPIAAIGTYYMTPDQRADIERRSEGRYTLVPIPRCAADQYPRLVLGENDVSVFERTLAWDHAAGIIVLNEAGGRVCRPDGSPYLIGDDRRGLLGAATPALWDEAARILYGD